MTDDDAGWGGGLKNGEFWMTSFVNDPLYTEDWCRNDSRNPIISLQ